MDDKKSKKVEKKKKQWSKPKLVLLDVRMTKGKPLVNVSEGIQNFSPPNACGTPNPPLSQCAFAPS